MKLATAWRPALLALALTGAFATTASAAVTELTMDPTAQLSPGQLHATLTGSITCDAGGFFPFVSGQIVQKAASGFGSSSAVCDGTSQPFAIDVSSGGFFGPGGVFKAGKANAQVSTTSCDPMTWVCSSRFVDGEIRLIK